MNTKDLVQGVVLAAIDATNQKKAHVFVNYSGHTNQVDVRAYPRSTVYQDDIDRVHLIRNTTIYLDDESSPEELKAILKQIQEL